MNEQEMNEQEVEQAKKELEEISFFVEEQPKYKITREDDDGFLIMVDDLKQFLSEVKK